MGRKIILLFTLVAFMVFSFSCYTTSQKGVRTVSSWNVKKAKHYNVVSLIKKSGEKIEFKKGNYGKIVKAGVEVGLSKKLVKGEIDILNIHQIHRDKNGNIYGIDTLEGKRIEILDSEESGDKIIYSTQITEYDVIPFSEIKSIRVNYFDSVKTIVLALGFLAVLSAVGALAFGAAFLNWGDM